MPSHPDRVRRNYHNIIIEEYHDLTGYEQTIIVKISRIDIASLMTRNEIKHMIGQKLSDSIDSQYRER